MFLKPLTKFLVTCGQLADRSGGAAVGRWVATKKTSSLASRPADCPATESTILLEVQTLVKGSPIIEEQWKALTHTAKVSQLVSGYSGTKERRSLTDAVKKYGLGEAYIKAAQGVIDGNEALSSCNLGKLKETLVGQKVHGIQAIIQVIVEAARGSCILIWWILAMQSTTVIIPGYLIYFNISIIKVEVLVSASPIPPAHIQDVSLCDYHQGRGYGKL
ncbi:hypothetical protein BDR05DRAFT_946547 [Suillus weaverae]|nr:hypothetical protein BDR05DRAFT_946547 [Suillus weaverae]